MAKEVQLEKTAYYKRIAARVDKGVEFLDKTYGNRRWVKKINTDILRMSSGFCCVIGQVFGRWGVNVTDEARVHNGYILTETQAAKLGFQSYITVREKHSPYSSRSEDSDQKKQLEYDTLQLAWVAKLESLRKTK